MTFLQQPVAHLGITLERLSSSDCAESNTFENPQIYAICHIHISID